MTWCGHRKGVNKGLSAAAALPAAIRADVLLLLFLLLSHLPSPLPPCPPPFHSVRLVLVGVRPENTALFMCVCMLGGIDVCVSVVFGGERLQISFATPAVLTDRCALYACASRVLSLLRNTVSAAEDARKCYPYLQIQIGKGTKG